MKSSVDGESSTGEEEGTIEVELAESDSEDNSFHMTFHRERRKLHLEGEVMECEEASTKEYFEEREEDVAEGKDLS